MLRRSQQYTPPVISRSGQHSRVKPQARQSSFAVMFNILHGGAVGGKPRQGLGQLLQLFLKQVDAVILGAVAADNILGEGMAGGGTAAAAIQAGEPALVALHLGEEHQRLRGIAPQGHDIQRLDLFIEVNILRQPFRGGPLGAHLRQIAGQPLDAGRRRIGIFHIHYAAYAAARAGGKLHEI